MAEHHHRARKSVAREAAAPFTIPVDESLPSIEALPGTELLIEVEGVYGHLKSELIGYHGGRYLVLRTPVGPTGLSGKLFRGNTLVVRYLEEGRAIGFQTTILSSTLEPEPLLFVACPKLLQERSLRQAQRLDTYVICKAAIQGRVVDGTLIDLSRAGFRCILPTHITDGVLRPHVGDRLVLNAELDGRTVQLSGVVRNVSEFPASVRLGVAFDENDRASEAHVFQFLLKEGVEV